MAFFCGGSRNFSHFIDLFDGVFVLEVDLDTLNQRLDRRPEDEWAASRWKGNSSCGRTERKRTSRKTASRSTPPRRSRTSLTRSFVEPKPMNSHKAGTRSKAPRLRQEPLGARRNGTQRKRDVRCASVTFIKGRVGPYVEENRSEAKKDFEPAVAALRGCRSLMRDATWADLIVQNLHILSSVSAHLHAWLRPWDRNGTWGGVLSRFRSEPTQRGRAGRAASPSSGITTVRSPAAGLGSVRTSPSPVSCIDSFHAHGPGVQVRRRRRRPAPSCAAWGRSRSGRRERHRRRVAPPYIAKPPTWRHTRPVAPTARCRGDER